MKYGHTCQIILTVETITKSRLLSEVFGYILKQPHLFINAFLYAVLLWEKFIRSIVTCNFTLLNKWFKREILSYKSRHLKINHNWNSSAALELVLQEQPLYPIKCHRTTKQKLNCFVIQEWNLYSVNSPFTLVYQNTQQRL